MSPVDAEERIKRALAAFSQSFASIVKKQDDNTLNLAKLAGQVKFQWWVITAVLVTFVLGIGSLVYIKALS